MPRDPFDDIETHETEPSRLPPILVGLLVLVAILLGSTVYLFLEVRDVKATMTQRFESLQMYEEQIAQLEGTVNRTTRAVDTQVEQVKGLVDEAEKEIQAKAREVETRVLGKTQDLQKEIQQTKAQQESAITQVGGKLQELEQVASQTDSKVGSLAGRVDTVKTEVDKTREELEKTIRELTSVKGDLGVQSGLIATNAGELDALRQLGEREYYEFDIQKSKQPHQVGPISIRLRKTKHKKNKYNIWLWADDNRIEKKDKTLLEPVQFYVRGSRIPYELVVNEISKNRIAGYLATPKGEDRRASSMASGTE